MKNYKITYKEIVLIFSIIFIIFIYYKFIKTTNKISKQEQDFLNSGLTTVQYDAQIFKK